MDAADLHQVPPAHVVSVPSYRARDHLLSRVEEPGVEVIHAAGLYTGCPPVPVPALVGHPEGMQELVDHRAENLQVEVGLGSGRWRRGWSFRGIPKLPITST